jgi:hypothetical protein
MCDLLVLIGQSVKKHFAEQLMCWSTGSAVQYAQCHCASGALICMMVFGWQPVLELAQPSGHATHVIPHNRSVGVGVVHNLPPRE